MGWGGSPLSGETGRKDHHSSELQSLFFSLPPSFLLSNLQFLATKTMGGDGGGGGDGHRRQKFSLRLPILRLYNPVYRFAAAAATISKKRLEFFSAVVPIFALKLVKRFEVNFANLFSFAS